MLAVFLAVFVSSSMADEVIGDRTLFAAVHAARDANIARFPHGSLKAAFELKVAGSKTMHIRGDVHVQWTPTVAFAERREEGNFSGELPAAKSERQPASDARVSRFLFEANRVSWYNPEAGLRGNLHLYSPARASQIFLCNEFTDLRPAKRWIRHDAVPFLPYSEFVCTDPPSARGNDRRWVLTMVGDEVHFQWYAKALKGVSGPVYKFSAQHGGLLEVTLTKESGFGWFTTIKKEWAREPNGGFWLTKYLEFHRYPDGAEVFKNLVVHEFSTAEPAPFSFDSLRVRSGATVNDDIKGARYTYTAKPVDPAALKRLGDKVAKEGAAVPKEE